MITYANRRVINGGYFYIKKESNTNKDLNYYLDQVNIDEYYIYKGSNKFREVSIDDILNHRYSGYIFFKKSIYDKNHIEYWIDYINTNKLDCRFLTKPLPPFKTDKIIIIEYDNIW